MVELNDLKGLFQQKQFYDSKFLALYLLATLFFPWSWIIFLSYLPEFFVQLAENSLLLLLKS